MSGAGNQPDSHSESFASSVHSVSAEISLADEPERQGASAAEPKIDPFLEKYMTIVKQQKEQEKKVIKSGENERERIVS